MRIYLSGPITGTDDYIKRFEAKANIFSEGGMNVINPAMLGAVMPSNATHEEYMRVCLPLVKMADLVLMMKGWENSVGCKMEHEFAINNNIKIIYEEHNEKS